MQGIYLEHLHAVSNRDSAMKQVILCNYYTVPENIHTHPKEDYWKF